MLPLLNGKSFLKCNEDDLKTLIGNTDYRENQYVDYKKAFAFLDMKGPEREAEIVEFRCDVCAFANSEGGYLIYGISEKDGVAEEILGIDVPKTDKFELERRNNLMAISPKIPPIQFGFIRLESGKYVVILEIKPDFYVPYIHIEKEKYYRIYTRSGNRKITMQYVELRNMFTASASFERELEEFRKNRIEYYQSQNEYLGSSEYSQFVLVHIIPRTFKDRSSHHLYYVEAKLGKRNLSQITNGLLVQYSPISTVDSVMFVDKNSKSEVKLYNNGIVEYFISKSNIVWKIKDYDAFSSDYVWKEIEQLLSNYNGFFEKESVFTNYYACISIIGCRGTVSEDTGLRNSRVYIDRNNIVCLPVEVSFSDATTTYKERLSKVELNYLLALSLRDSKRLHDILKAMKE